MTKVVYTSPIFNNANGEGRKFLIPVDALTTYAKRDECLIKMIDMGGIYAKPTPEYLKIRSKMLSAKRKIERQGWYSVSI